MQQHDQEFQDTRAAEAVELPPENRANFLLLFARARIQRHHADVESLPFYACPQTLSMAVNEDKPYRNAVAWEVEDTDHDSSAICPRQLGALASSKDHAGIAKPAA